MVKKIAIKTKKGTIRGSLHYSGNKNNLLLILLHGFTSNKDGPYGLYKKLALELTKNNLNVFRFDFLCSGESDGQLKDMSIKQELEDFEIVLTWLKRRGFSNIGVVGESLGGTIAILGYKEYFKKLILINPAINLVTSALRQPLNFRLKNLTKIKSFIKQWGFNNIPPFIKEIFKIRLTPYIRKLTIPVLIIHGTADTYVPLRQSYSLIKKLPNGSVLEIIKGENHGLIKNQNLAIDKIISWLSKDD